MVVGFYADGWQSLRSQKCPKQGALQEKNPNTSYESRTE